MGKELEKVASKGMKVESLTGEKARNEVEERGLFSLGITRYPCSGSSG